MFIFIFIISLSEMKDVTHTLDAVSPGKQTPAAQKKAKWHLGQIGILTLVKHLGIFVVICRYYVKVVFVFGIYFFHVVFSEIYM